MKIGSIPIFSVFGTELERFLLYNTRILSGIQRKFFFSKMQNLLLWDYTEDKLINLKNCISVDTSNKDSPISLIHNLIIFQYF